ncbi:MAG: hypothetical protein PHV73_05760 [Eubacteriales bacterium]|nr:hypothetical protein [Eubacteriales bacterium]
MKKRNLLIYYLILAVALFIWWYFSLLPINLRHPGFFIALIVISALILLPFLGLFSFGKQDKKKSDAFNKEDDDGVYREQAWPFGFIFRVRVDNKPDSSQKPLKRYFNWIRAGRSLLWIPIILLLLYFVLQLSGAKLFRSRDYADLINKVEGDFAEDVYEIEFYDIPTVDRDTATRLGNKKMGEMAELVSQFEVASDYTQINYKDRPTRVTPLRYVDFFKWFNNRKEGLPKVVMVDLISGEVNMHQLSSGMKYSDSDLFFRNISRHLRFKYPTAIMGDERFEVDEEGTPYWIVPVLKPQVGWFDGQDVTDVILCNAITGESEKLPVEECPTWADRIYPSELVIEQLDWNGIYQDGFFNSLIGQRGVLRTTQGYNYLALYDDVYLYTGITSVASDSSNLGFVLVNLRTKETKFYPVSSADEYSAMASAEGAVQEKRYRSTFPILLNVGDEPTYCMALKDDAQLVKMYALVNAKNYQVTATGFSIREALANYQLKLAGRLQIDDDDDTPNDNKPISISGTLTDIQSIVMEGNSYYYLLLEGHDEVFSAQISVSQYLPFLEAGVELTLICEGGEIPAGSPRHVISIEWE